ncbi:MAG: phosphatidylserine decarboxylase [Hespellia sp.]|nr:phosphatidylserine decarboxylase [Hespellia sp.]
MKYMDRYGTVTTEDSTQDRFLRMLYTNTPGRMLLKPLVSPLFSKIGGSAMNTRLSAGLISGFIRHNAIDLRLYEPKIYSSYNDFFTRRIRPQYRPIAGSEDILISPCDGKLSVYPIHNHCSLCIKDTVYTVSQLIGSRRLAAKYADGYATVIRLTVDDYHRYCYVADGLKSKQHRIPGIFHTVNPIANDVMPIYKMNTREFCLLKTKNMGTILSMEVGALMVGKIVNNESSSCPVTRGAEKGRFEFGGSTIVLLLQKDAVTIDADLLANTRAGYETYVKYGEQIAVTLNT